MKSIILSLILLFFVLNLFSQQRTNSNVSRDHYFKKSKNQKKVATILLTGGAASILIAALIPKGKYTGNFFYPSYKNDAIRFTFIGIGTVSMLASVPFYIASSKNKRRANAIVSFNNQKVIFAQQNSFVLKTQPTIKLSYKFPD